MPIDASTIEAFDGLPTSEQMKILEYMGGMDEAISKKLKDLPEVKDSAGALRASSIPYYLKCPHRGYLDLMVVPRKDIVPAKLRWIFDIGTKFHELMQEGITDKSRGNASEAYLDHITGDGEWLASRIDEAAVWAEDLLMSGHSDSGMVLTHPSWNMRAGLEVKSINDNGFNQIRRSNKPKEQHVQQGLFYQWTLDLPVMIYFYINKNNQDRHVIPMPFDDKLWWEDIYPKLRAIVEAAQGGESPGKEIGYHCRECPFNPLSCEPGKHTRKL